MEQSEIINLIKDGVIPGTWADLGSGTGNFTLALRKLTGPEVKIYSVDKNILSLEKQKEEFLRLFPDTDVTFVLDDFGKDLSIPNLDGILMANSLHFVKYKDSLIDKLKNSLKEHGRMIIVEYDTDKGNIYVPHPLSFGNLKRLLEEKGFSVRQIGQAASRYQNSMYSCFGNKN